ncbi:MAG: hypothetical protein H7101_02990 [Deinococcales bacterium]|nr:hypothetical protein [Chitinophagaceae bacterium]
MFSRETVCIGSITKYAQNPPKANDKVVQKALFKGGYQVIDDSFLKYIDGIHCKLR